MTENPITQRLAAILAADVAGYSRLMRDDERATVIALDHCRLIFRKHIEANQGRVVDMAGDSVLAVFDTAIGAAQTAVTIQEALAERNRNIPDHRKMLFRVGVHLGDVIEKPDGTVYGDGVNIAARLQTLAQPDGIALSGMARDAVHTRLQVRFADLGSHEVKNIADPVRVFQVLMDGSPEVQLAATRKLPRSAIAATAALAFLAIALAFWQSTRTVQGPKSAESTTERDPVLALPTGPSIAVLPFQNLSGDAQQEYFSDGLTADLINRLSQFPRFFVIARNSTEQYRGQGIDVRGVGRDLGASYVVEGSVRKDTNAIRVTVQLLDAKDGTDLWAETYDRDLTAASIFSIQDDITLRIAGTVADEWGVLTRARTVAVRDRPTNSLDAYECTLRAMNYYDDQYNSETHLSVRDCLERAVKGDPEYADAWAWLAMMYTDETRYGFNPQPDSLERALMAARRAIKIDGDNSWAAVTLAQVHFTRGELDEFITEGERALQLHPNDPTAVSVIGLLLVNMGEIDKGMALLDKAMKLNPMHPNWYYYPISHGYYHLGEYEKSLDAALKINLPDFYWTHVVLARAYGQLGRKTHAQAAVENILRLFPGYAAKARDDFRKWNFPEESITHQIEGLRKAGLDIPDEPPPQTN